MPIFIMLLLLISPGVFAAPVTQEGTKLPQSYTAVTPPAVIATIPEKNIAPVTDTASTIFIVALTVTAEATSTTIPAQVTFTTQADYTPKDFKVVMSDKAIKLNWKKEDLELIYYNVYRRIEKAPYKIIGELLPIVEYIDSNINTGTGYSYKVEGVDKQGQMYMSKSENIKTAELLPPMQPEDFRALQDVQAVLLKWTQAVKGTGDISGYNVYRGKSINEMTLVKFIPLKQGNTMAYEDMDGIEYGVKYYYKLKAVDTTGLESKAPPVVGATPLPAPRTGLVLMPSAFRNDISNNYGLNVDIMFAYFIGSMYGQHNITTADAVGDAIVDKGNDAMGKLGVWLLTGDAKWTFFNEGDTMPSFGAGYMYTILLQDSIGAGGSSQTTGGSASFSLGTKDSFKSMQGFYFVMSKNVIWDFTLHGGYLVGNQLAFMPYLSTYLYDYFPTGSEKLTKDKILDKGIYAGISRPLFGRTGIRVEYITTVGASRSPYIINTHIDHFINFDVSYFKFNGGYAWLGYINFRFTVFPNPYK